MEINSMPISLAELRRRRGMSQGELAGISQAAVLKTERSGDPRLATVTRFVEALGGRLRILASFDEGDYPLTFATGEPPVIASSTIGEAAAWRIRAWKDPLLERRFLRDGIIAVGDGDIEQAVTAFDTDQALRRELEKVHSDRGSVAIGMFVTYWRHFHSNMKVGDTIVLALSGKPRKAAIGTVVGEYEYTTADPDRRLHHRRAVQWRTVIECAMLDDDLRKTINAPGTICRFGAIDADTRLARAM